MSETYIGRRQQESKVRRKRQSNEQEKKIYNNISMLSANINSISVSCIRRPTLIYMRVRDNKLAGDYRIPNIKQAITFTFAYFPISIANFLSLFSSFHLWCVLCTHWECLCMCAWLVNINVRYIRCFDIMRIRSELKNSCCDNEHFKPTHIHCGTLYHLMVMQWSHIEWETWHYYKFEMNGKIHRMKRTIDSEIGKKNWHNSFL